MSESEIQELIKKRHKWDRAMENDSVPRDQYVDAMNKITERLQELGHNGQEVVVKAPISISKPKTLKNQISEEQKNAIVDLTDKLEYSTSLISRLLGITYANVSSIYKKHKDTKRQNDIAKIISKLSDEEVNNMLETAKIGGEKHPSTDTIHEVQQ